MVKERFDFNNVIAFFGGLFVVLKVYDSFWGTAGSIGGFWNYIQIFFILLAFVMICLRSKMFFNYQPIRTLLSFALLAFVFSALFLKDLTVNTLFNWAMILFAPSVLILFFYIGTKKSIDTFRLFLIVYYISIILLIISYLMYYAGAKFQKGDSAKVYYIVGLLPLAIMYTKKRKLLPIALAISASLISAKRGALVAVLLMLVIWIAANNAKDKVSMKKTIKTILLFAIIIAFVFIAFNYVNSNINQSLLHKYERLSYDGGSGRIDRWMLAWSKFYSSDIASKFIGHGKDSIIAAVGGNAHNDFLEVLYNHGIIVLILYVSFYVSLIKKYFEMRKYAYFYSEILAMSIIGSLCIAMYSFYVIDANFIICGMMTYGLILADFERTKYYIDNAYLTDDEELQ